MLEGTLKDCRVQLLALHSTIPKSNPMFPRALSNSFLNPVRLVLGPLPWGAVPLPDHPLGEELFPDIQPQPPLAQLAAASWSSPSLSELPRCGELWASESACKG